MEVFCPQCNQAFVLPDGAVPPAGRKMKCSKCAHVWHQPGSDTDANDAAEAPAGAAPLAATRRTPAASSSPAASGAAAARAAAVSKRVMKPRRGQELQNETPSRPINAL